MGKIPPHYGESLVKLKLTPKEREVLYGLVRWPESTDYELSDMLDLARTTVTVIRQRLERKGVVFKTLVPDFKRVGCELLTILYGEYNDLKTGELEGFDKTISENISSAYYTIRSGGLHLSLGASKSLTEVVGHIRKHHGLHHDNGFLTDKRHNYVFFPLEHTKVSRFFDYAPLIAERFGLKHEDKKEKKVKTRHWRPTKRERIVFNELIKNPGASDEKVSKHSKVSRQTVNNLKNKFKKQGLIRPLKIPDIRTLGFNLLSFTHLHMNPHHNIKDREEYRTSLLDDPGHLLKISGDFESILISAHKDYTEYRKSYEKMMDTYQENKLLLEEPVTQLYPLDQSRHILHHDYSRIVSGVTR